MVRRHQVECGVHAILLAAGDDRGGKHVGDPDLAGIEAPRDDPVEQVAVGHDAAEIGRAADGQRADVEFAHQLRRGGDRGLRRDEFDFPRHEFGDPHGRATRAGAMPFPRALGAARISAMTTTERLNGDPDDDAFLQAVGARLRTLRARRGVTRRDLSRLSRVSERYIAQLEAGTGNVSILLLRRIARALGIEAKELVEDQAERSVERVLLEQLVAQLPDSQLAEAREMLQRRFGRQESRTRARRLALIGLRGAGKSTLGRRLAERLGVRFVELDREVEREGRMELSDIFAMHGQEGFRRLERASLERLVREDAAAVIAAGGGIVAEPATFGLLLDTCVTVWLRASPEDHMQRVIEQGDTRPMRDNRRAMDDLRAILDSRAPLYARADFTVDTSGPQRRAGAGRAAGAAGAGHGLIRRRRRRVPGSRGRRAGSRWASSPRRAPPRRRRPACRCSRRARRRGR